MQNTLYLPDKMSMRRKSSIILNGANLSPGPSSEMPSKKSSLTLMDHQQHQQRLHRISDASASGNSIDPALMAAAKVNTPTTPSDYSTHVVHSDYELNIYYGIVKRLLLRYQNPVTGLYPPCSSDKEVGSVRDTLYCCMATWSLCQAYKKVDDDLGKSCELGNCTILGLRGILMCWMRQVSRLENFKTKQSPEHALHAHFNLETGFEIFEAEEYGHLQIDVVSHFLLFLVQAIASGLKVIYAQSEVNFVQNLVFYVERAYRTPDFGMWERGSTYNDGTCEVHASSIGMAKAALESINGVNLFGTEGSQWSVVYVDIDAHNRNRSIFETLLPRESATKEIDVALLPSISFPFFATHDQKLYKATKERIETLEGSWGFKRFLRDGYGCVNEPEGSGYYPEGVTQQFAGIESEWPMFHAFMVIDGVFKNNHKQVDKHQRALKQLIKFTDRGDPVVPKYYYVPEESIADERAKPGSSYRMVSDEGSSSKNVYLWGQAMLIISDLLATSLLMVHEVDPIRRHLPSATRPRFHDRYSTFEKGHGLDPNPHDTMVQIVMIAESRRLQAKLKTFGIETQTPEEIEPIQIWSQWDMVKIFERLGECEQLGMTGRPARPIGALGSSKIYRVGGQTVICYPLIFSSTEFYISHDLALLTDHIRTDINFISRRWRLRGRPTYCIIITEANFKDHQFSEMLALLMEIRSLKLDGVKLSLGRLQNLMNSACVEHLDFSNNINWADLDVEPFVQLQHKPTLTHIEMAKQLPKTESIQNFQVGFESKSSEEIVKVIVSTDHLYQKIQLLGILMKRHGDDFQVDNLGTVRSMLEDLNKKVGNLRYWAAVRYSSSLLKQMIDSISPYITQILVNGKKVTVGTIGMSYTLFDKPMTPAEIHEALYSKVQPYNMISAVLQQELIVYCGKLIASDAELFDGILVVRMGWVLKSLELYRDMTEDKPEPIEHCSPHTIRKLVYIVLKESRAIDLNFSHKKDKKKAAEDGDDVDEVLDLDTRKLSSGKKLSVYDVRQLSGCLLRVPVNFYSDIWHILKKTKGGIYMMDRHLPQEPTCSKMTSTELSFAYLFESMLNVYKEPVYKQMAVEFFSVLSKIMQRHPEMSLIENLRVEAMIDSAIGLYAKDQKLEMEEARTKFLQESVSHTSAYLGKSILIKLLDAKSLFQFATDAAASEFHCQVQ